MGTLSIWRASKQRLLIKPGGTGLAGVYLAYGAVFLRTFAVEGLRPYLPVYLVLELAYLILFTLMFTRTKAFPLLAHLYFVIQSILILVLVSIYPEFDFIVVLFMLLSFQVALFLSGRALWIWIAILVTLTGGSLILYLGLLRGLALALTTIAAEIVIPAFVLVNQEIQDARSESQALLNNLQETHKQLEMYSMQVEELSTLQERNRLARELHDTVSQLMFSMSLTSRSAQLLLEKDPSRVPSQLDELARLSSQALSQLRSLITQLRPPHDSAV